MNVILKILLKNVCNYRDMLLWINLNGLLYMVVGFSNCCICLFVIFFFECVK